MVELESDTLGIILIACANPIKTLLRYLEPPIIRLLQQKMH